MKSDIGSLDAPTRLETEQGIAISRASISRSRRGELNKKLRGELTKKTMLMNKIQKIIR